MNPSIEIRRVDEEIEYVLRLSKANLLVILGAQREANEELEEWEFETRMGVPKAAVMQFSEQLRAKLERAQELHADVRE